VEEKNGTFLTPATESAVLALDAQHPRVGMNQMTFVRCRDFRPALTPAPVVAPVPQPAPQPVPQPVVGQRPAAVLAVMQCVCSRRSEGRGVGPCFQEHLTRT
jgi:hypothetical protein